MKKMFMVIISCFLLVGCNSSNLSEETEMIIQQDEKSEEVKESEDLYVEENSKEQKFEEIYKGLKNEMYKYAKELEYSDEMTGIMLDSFETSFNYTCQLESFSDIESELLSDFLIPISYLDINFSDDSIGNEIGVMGWDAIYSLIMQDGSFSDKMSELKNLYEENINPIFETKYKSGQYKIGSDIPAGEYVIFADGGPGYFEVTSDANGDDIIANENFEYNSIMTIVDGEYLKLSRAYAVPIEDVESLSMDMADMFKIGVFLPAGEYKVVSDSDSGYYCIYGDNRQGNIIANDNFDGQSYLTVSDGQYLVLSRCHIE